MQKRSRSNCPGHRVGRCQSWDRRPSLSSSKPSHHIELPLSSHSAASLHSEMFSWGPWAPDQGRTGAAPGRNSTESLAGSEGWGLPLAPGSPPCQSPQAVASSWGTQAGVRSQAGAESRLPVSPLWCSRELWSSWYFLSHWDPSPDPGEQLLSCLRPTKQGCLKSPLTQVPNRCSRDLYTCKIPSPFHNSHLILYESWH